MEQRANAAIASECLELRARVRAAGITQTELAAALNVSQAQISRVLSGQLVGRSKLLDELSVYVRVISKTVSADMVRNRQALIEALAETWDGTVAHERALVAVIRSLGAFAGLPDVKKLRREA